MNYYSQEGEDQYLYEEFLSVVPPSYQNYIEIGALDGLKYSNTKFLEETLNWTGVLIEPNPLSFARLEKNRPNNELVQCLISNSTEEVEYTYFENENLAAVSGITNTLTEKNKSDFFESEEEWLQKAKQNFLRKTNLNPLSLDAVIEQSQSDKFGFCSIDVEGHELQVLQSYSFKADIAILLIERNPNNQEIADLLERNDYVFHGVVSHNNVFLLRSYYDQLQSKKLSKTA